MRLLSSRHQKKEIKMSVRCLLLVNYIAESLKGILGGSDRIAAAKAVAEAAGGTLTMCSFVRGPYDIVLDMNVPSQDMMMGAMAMVRD